MQKKIRVGAVSYLNTKPLIYGFEQGLLQDQIELILDYPSRLAQAMQKKQLDIALLPVASIPTITDATLFSKYCIASDKKVASVCLFSEVPIEDIQTVFLDYQSKTSVALFRILMKDYWQIRPSLVEAEEGYIEKIKHKTAGLIIGDRALQHLQSFPYVYDLAEAWHQHTQHAFVFATWVSNIELDSEFIQAFDAANAVGFTSLPTIISAQTMDSYDLQTYYHENIAYEMTVERRQGMQLFLNRIAAER